jgi:hypothetical protein
MDAALFEELEQTLATKGSTTAIDRLCTLLRERKDYSGLFYALLMKKRHELGVSPLPTGPAQDLPERVHQPYEDAIREAGRLVGGLYLEEGNIPQAWAYFRMLGEPDPVKAALDRVQPGEGEDCQQLVDIAFHQGVHPTKGFDLILQRYGLCSAITTASGIEFPPGSEVRQHCIKRLVRALYAELCDRLKVDIERREGQAPAVHTVREIMAGRDYLFEDEFYHVDVSHLQAVVQMSVHLAAGEELQMARELCAYGQRLSPRFRHAGDPPFEDHYADYAVYLATLAGDRVDEGIAHFRRKAENADPDTVGTFPAEVLINLLLRLDRPGEALAAARRFLAKVDDRQLTCPGIQELCQRVNDYRTLAEVARERQDPVHFVASLIAANNSQPTTASS